MCKITILMPVKNGGKYIEEAIDSVLKQSFTDFELLIMNDASTDDTIEIIQSYTDYRIRLMNVATGLVENLNAGLQLAKGEYIARLDADDIMHSERLKIQIKRMEKERDIAVCSSWAKCFNDEGKPMPSIISGNKIIANSILELLKGNFMIHPSVMIRKSFLQRNKLCYKNYLHTEDYKLWFDIAVCGGALFIEPQELLFYRVHDKQVSALNTKEMRRQSCLLRKEILNYLLNTIKNSEILTNLYHNMEVLEKEKKIMYEEIFQLFYTMLKRSISQD